MDEYIFLVYKCHGLLLYLRLRERGNGTFFVFNYCDGLHSVVICTDLGGSTTGSHRIQCRCACIDHGIYSDLDVHVFCSILCKYAVRDDTKSSNQAPLYALPFLFPNTLINVTTIIHITTSARYPPPYHSSRPSSPLPALPLLSTPSASSVPSPAVGCLVDGSIGDIRPHCQARVVHHSLLWLVGRTFVSG